METVENDPDRGMIGAAHDLPGVAVVVDMPAPGQRLVADAKTPRPRALAELVEIRRGAIDAAERGRLDVAARACPRNRGTAGTRRWRVRGPGTGSRSRAGGRQTTVNRSRRSRLPGSRRQRWHAAS